MSGATADKSRSGPAMDSFADGWERLGREDVAAAVADVRSLGRDAFLEAGFPASGEEAWKSAPVERRETIPTNITPTLVVYEDVVLFYGATRKLTGLSAETGEILWTGPHPRSGHFCPEDVLTRAEVAVLVARAFDLDNINSCIGPTEKTTGPTGNGSNASGVVPL